jgi:hypothetical protein
MKTRIFKFGNLMKLLAFFVLMSFAACTVVTFDEPQPVDIDNLAKLPKRIQGQYISLADSSTLCVSDKMIRRIYDFEYRILARDLDSNYKFVGDTIININTDEKEMAKKVGDTLVVRIHSVDTLFELNYDNVVRKYKGYYFINTRCGKGSWEVKKIELLKGRLQISSISTKQDVENLKAIAESTQDTVAPYQFSVTKKQFKEFIRNGGFSDNEIFVKQKKNSL